MKRGEKALQVWRPILKRYTEEEAAEILSRTGRRLPRDHKGQLPKRPVGWGVASVFDLSQTEGDEVEVPAGVTVTRRMRAPGGARPELLTGEDTTGAQADVESLIRAEGYSFHLVPRELLGGANGITKPGPRRVEVRDDVDPAQRVRTTVHELAHIRCQHVADEFDYVTHRGQAETEAESVAYIVAGALGLDAEKYSAPYVATWCEGDMELVSRSAGTIVRVASEILRAIEDSSSDGDVELSDSAA